jgi:KDO2-lipid IV(A) lauroyltransferase
MMLKQSLYESLTAGFQSLSLPHLQLMGRLLGQTLWTSLPARRKLAQEAISFHLGLAPREARSLARKNFAHIGCSYMEIFASRKIDYRFLEDRVDIVNSRQFRKVFEQQRPLVAVTGHLGAWELFTGVLRLHMGTRKAQIVVQRQKDEALLDVQARLRARRGIEIVHNKQRGSGLHRNLKQNGLCAFLVDHNCGRRKALFLPFLNKTAAVNKGPAQLAVFANALVWPIFFIRNQSQSRYTIIPHTPLDVSALAGSKADKVTAVTRFYTGAVEDMVRSYPEQWYWIHKRWKTRPPDQSPSERDMSS